VVVLEEDLMGLWRLKAGWEVACWRWRLAKKGFEKVLDEEAKLISLPSLFRAFAGRG
jgi:hypothetical protein